MNLKFLAALVGLVMVTGALTFGGSAVYTALTGQSLIDETRTEQCELADAGFDRDRATIVDGQVQLYRLPEFQALVATPRAQRRAYNIARKRYRQVNDVRPTYCPALVGPDTHPPFPKLADFRANRVRVRAGRRIEIRRAGRGRSSSDSGGRSGPRRSTRTPRPVVTPSPAPRDPFPAPVQRPEGGGGGGSGPPGPPGPPGTPGTPGQPTITTPQLPQVPELPQVTVPVPPSDLFGP